MPTTDPRGEIVLDTHVIVWWQAQSSRLSHRALTRIEDARRLLVSPISFWELAMLVAKGRVSLDRPAAAWVRDFLSTDRVEVANLTPAIAVAAGELPDFHGDPADRLIVASARSHDAALISKDSQIRDYCGTSRIVRVVW